jgi:hypothetical protein
VVPVSGARASLSASTQNPAVSVFDSRQGQWWRERDETLTDIARSYNIKAYGVKEDAALPENSGTVFVR